MKVKIIKEEDYSKNNREFDRDFDTDDTITQQEIDIGEEIKHLFEELISNGMGRNI